MNVLMGLWRFVTAREIRVIEDCREELAALLRGVTPEWVLDPSNWKRLAGFARIIPDGDVLPLRAKYRGNSWQIGVNYVHASSDDPTDGLWYAWPDLVASVLLTGKVPRIVEAFRIAPIGKAKGLKKIAFRGQVPIDPRSQDFFKAVIEERARLAARTDLSEAERDRLRRSLKTLGSATSYGIFAQMDRQESDKEVAAHVLRHRPDAVPVQGQSIPKHRANTAFRRWPRSLPAAAICCSRCWSGSSPIAAARTRWRTPTPWRSSPRSAAASLPARVAQIRRRTGARRFVHYLGNKSRRSWRCFAQLNPYDRTAVPHSILKIEDDNFDPKTGKQRQLWCLAISAKRYVLFLRDRNGEPELLRKGVNNGEDGWSQHGLGHLLNPSDPTSEDRSWIAQAWLGIVRRSLGLATEPLPFADRVALGSDHRQQSRGAAAAGEAQRRQAVRAADQAVQLHPELPRRAVRSSGRRRSGALSPDRAVRNRSAQVARNCRGSISIQANSTASARRSRRARGRSRASRAMATCSKSTSSTKRPSAPMPAARRATSKPWGCCSGGT